MILFVNFAPIQFMGGVEMWMVKMQKELNSKGVKVKFLNASPSIANIYAQIVLKRKFDFRDTSTSIEGNLSIINLKSFLPFSRSWKEVNKLMSDAELIYTKFEVLELSFLIYFGGMKILRKSIAGIRSPYYYYYPIEFMDRFHNWVYTRSIISFFINKFKKVHVLTNRNKHFFRDRLNVNKTIEVPNYISMKKFNNSHESSNVLRTIFVGELKYIKGLDIVIETIKNLPENFEFTIVGDGFMKSEVVDIAKTHKNVHYLGHVKYSDLHEIYEQHDVLFFPSRAEGFGNVFLEAMNAGLMIVGTDAVNLSFPDYIEISGTDNHQDYVDILKKILSIKKTKGIDREAIWKYCDENYADNIVIPKLLKDIFEVS